jgi:hypothetical protein
MQNNCKQDEDGTNSKVEVLFRREMGEEHDELQRKAISKESSTQDGSITQLCCAELKHGQSSIVAAFSAPIAIGGYPLRILDIMQQCKCPGTEVGPDPMFLMR